MNKQKFIDLLMGLLECKGITTNAKVVNMWFEMMKNDFTDDEFSAICTDVFKNEEFYGKMPDPALFYKRKTKQTPDDRYNKALNDFILKVEIYLSSGFVYDDQREQFYSGLMDYESKCLQSMGGMPDLYQSVHSESYPKKISSITKELTKKFEHFYNEQEVGLKLTHIGEHKEELSSLINNAVKRIR